jgi:DNA invertase Pin-like site-specific DNA recombinase
MVPKRQKFVTYYRVSTLKQGKSGLGIEAQKASVQTYLDAHDGVELASFVEVESGKVNTRPKLEAALLRCRQCNAILLVAKLDRLSRNAAFLMNLRDAGVRFQALDIPDCNTLTLGVLASLAQHERELISQRTKAALAARKARGLPLGTPRDLSAHRARGATLGHGTMSANAKRRAEEVQPAIKAAVESGCATLKQIAVYLDGMEITTPRGGRWTPTAVRNAQKLMADNASL